MPEFNAILKQFNIFADPGTKDSYINQKGGLLYRVTDENGTHIGVPIKASSINNKPTLSHLNTRFEINTATRDPLKAKLKNTIDEVLNGQVRSFREFINRLEDNHVYTVVRQNEEGRMYGITFVDNKNKSVFNGSDIGKGYSIANLQKRILTMPNGNESDNAKGRANPVFTKSSAPIKSESIKSDLLDVLLTPQQHFENTPFPLLKKKRKKKRRI